MNDTLDAGSVTANQEGIEGTLSNSHYIIGDLIRLSGRGHLGGPRKRSVHLTIWRWRGATPGDPPASSPCARHRPAKDRSAPLLHSHIACRPETATPNHRPADLPPTQACSRRFRTCMGSPQPATRVSTPSAPTPFSDMTTRFLAIIVLFQPSPLLCQAHTTRTLAPLPAKRPRSLRHPLSVITAACHQVTGLSPD